MDDLKHIWFDAAKYMCIWPGKLVPFQLHQLFIYLSNFRQSIRWASRKWKCQFAKWFCRLYKSFGVHTNGVHACVQLIRSDFSQFSIRSHVLFIHLLIEKCPFDIFELLLCGRIGLKWKISNVLLTKIPFSVLHQNTWRTRSERLPSTMGTNPWCLSKRAQILSRDCTLFARDCLLNQQFFIDPFQVKKKNTHIGKVLHVF